MLLAHLFLAKHLEFIAFLDFIVRLLGHFRFYHCNHKQLPFFSIVAILLQPGLYMALLTFYCLDLRDPPMLQFLLHFFLVCTETSREDNWYRLIIVYLIASQFQNLGSMSLVGAVPNLFAFQVPCSYTSYFLKSCGG